MVDEMPDIEDYPGYLERKEKGLALDLFSGLGGWGSAFHDSPYWDVIGIEFDKRFKDVPGTRIMDVMDFDVKTLPKRPDIVLGGPPCTRMSVASLRHYWGKVEGYDGWVPGKAAREHIELFRKTLSIIYDSGARYYIIENPAGMAKHVLGPPDHLTYFCIWLPPDPETGKLPPKKPTFLWYHLPPFIQWLELQPDTWEKASRGAQTGTQGIKDPAKKAKIPYELSRFVRDSIDIWDLQFMYQDPPMVKREFNDFSKYPLPGGKK